MLGDNIIQSKLPALGIGYFCFFFFLLKSISNILGFYSYYVFQWTKLTYGVRSQDSGLCEGEWLGGVRRDFWYISISWLDAGYTGDFGKIYWAAHL